MQQHTELIAYSAPMKYINGQSYFLYADQVYLSTEVFYNINSSDEPVAALQFTPVNEMPKVVLSGGVSIGDDVFKFYIAPLTYAESGDPVSTAVFDPDKHRLVPIISFDSVKLMRAHDDTNVMVGVVKSIDTWMQVDKKFKMSSIDCNIGATSEKPPALTPQLANKQHAYKLILKAELLLRLDGLMNHTEVTEFYDWLVAHADDRANGDIYPIDDPVSPIGLYTIADRLKLISPKDLLAIVKEKTSYHAFIISLSVFGGASSYLKKEYSVQVAQETWLNGDGSKHVFECWHNDGSKITSYLLTVLSFVYGIPARGNRIESCWFMHAKDIYQGTNVCLPVSEFLSFRAVLPPKRSR